MKKTVLGTILLFFIAFAALFIISSIGSCIGNVNTNSSTIIEDSSTIL